MRPLPIITGSIIVLSVLTTGASQTASTQAVDMAERAVILRAFESRTAAYVTLRRRLEASLPPLQPTSDPKQIFAARRLLAVAVRSARANAQEGDVFTPDIADVLRSLIAEVLRDRDIESVATDLQEEYPGASVLWPEINESYPVGAVSHEVPCAVLQALPPLAGGLEYRIVNRHLLLWDTHANLIVDFVPYAFGRLDTHG
jgi:hypothetical protein